MNRSTIVVFSLAALALTTGCKNQSADATTYRPSMTQLRLGDYEYETDDIFIDVMIPEDEFVFSGFSVPDQATLDGAGNDGSIGGLTDFANMIELENPTPLEKHIGEYDYTLGAGSLFDENEDESTLQFDDVDQGAIGDCYLVAALSSVVASDPTGEVTDGMVRQVNDADGNFLNYVVRFYDAAGDPQDIQVDPQLTRRNDKPLYARSSDSSIGNEELWVGLVEKAYAKWHNNFEEIGNGGYSGDVMQALTGASASWRQLKSQTDNSLFDAISGAVEEGRPVVAGTFGEDSGVDYAGTGVYAWHAYSVLDAEKTEDGEYRVQLRNPWGSSEPADNGEDDGIFWLPFRDFRTLYSSISYGGSYERDFTAPANVVDLKIIGAQDALAATFTATGDDATSGLAHAYDIRVLKNGELSDTNFFDADSIEAGGPQSPGTAESVKLPAMEPGDYTIAIVVQDESGNRSALSNVVSFTVSGPETIVPDVTDPVWSFVDGPQGWIAEGDFVFDDSAWYLGDPATGNYDFGRPAFGRLVSPTIDLTEMTNPYILWDHVLDVESSEEYDHAYLEVSSDGFATSTRVWEKSFVSVEQATDFAYLDTFAGQTVQLAFVFDSIDEVDNLTSGWRIDTVIIDDDI